MSSPQSRRAFLVATSASLVWMFTGGGASAMSPTISAGSPCKIKGKERTVNGVTFICREAKGKLAWRKKQFATVVQSTTVRILESAELELGKTKIKDVQIPGGGIVGIVLTRTAIGVTALRVNCTHAGFPVGRVGNLLQCELHGSQFDPATGAVLMGPAAKSLLRYEASESNGGVYVTISAT